ncbi:Rieske 2Fe-2S domain-containing protein [Acinetobacter sp. 1207_04]|uniref:Rieske (2Fe-2S) protein n=1 Tax=Acinetobacter sp. 1207_04 TaxID=2604449 RepID=UPI0040587E4B
MTARFQVPQEKIPTSGARAFLKVDEKFLVLFNINQQFYAIDDSCPHQGASLFSGKLEGKSLQCCAHGLKFDLESGYMLNSTHLKMTSYLVEVIESDVFIVMDSGA